MKKRILADHKKVGKKMIPPIYQHPEMNVQEGDYATDTLPEIIWMGLIHKELGYRRGIEFIQKFLEYVKESRNPESEYISFTIASDFYKLSDEESKKLVEKLLDKGLLLELSDMLSPITYFYKDHPFKFCNVEVDLTPEEEQDLLSDLKKCIHSHSDRFKKDSLISMANVMYIQGIDGKLHYPSHIKPPDLNALIERPGSEEALHAESSVRNHVKMDIMRHNDPMLWSKSFWNQSFHLDRCEFTEDYYD